MALIPGVTRRTSMWSAITAPEGKNAPHAIFEPLSTVFLDWLASGHASEYKLPDIISQQLRAKDCDVCVDSIIKRNTFNKLRFVDSAKKLHFLILFWKTDF